MVGVVTRIVELVRRGEGACPVGNVDESVAFLEWLLEDNFVFLGYREYELMDTDEGRALQAVPASGLGILTESAMSKRVRPTLLSSLPPQLATRYESGDLLVVSKSNRLSTVHRRAHGLRRGSHRGVWGRDGGESACSVSSVEGVHGAGITYAAPPQELDDWPAPKISSKAPTTIKPSSHCSRAFPRTTSSVCRSTT